MCWVKVSLGSVRLKIWWADYGFRIEKKEQTHNIKRMDLKDQDKQTQKLKMTIKSNLKELELTMNRG